LSSDEAFDFIDCRSSSRTVSLDATASLASTVNFCATGAGLCRASISALGLSSITGALAWGGAEDIEAKVRISERNATPAWLLRYIINTVRRGLREQEF